MVGRELGGERATEVAEDGLDSEARGGRHGDHRRLTQLVHNRLLIAVGYGATAAATFIFGSEDLLDFLRS